MSEVEANEPNAHREQIARVRMLIREIELAQNLIDQAITASDPDAVLVNIVNAEQIVSKLEQALPKVELTNEQRTDICELVASQRAMLNAFYNRNA